MAEKIQDLTFYPGRVFMELTDTRFTDIFVGDENALVLVEHRGHNIAPGDTKTGYKQFFRHHDQLDRNRMLSGARSWELVDTTGTWKNPHYVIYLTPQMGALEIPNFAYHRSINADGPQVGINHAVRTEGYEEKSDFAAVDSSTDPKLMEILERDEPVFINITREQYKKFEKTGRF